MIDHLEAQSSLVVNMEMEISAWDKDKDKNMANKLKRMQNAMIL